MSGRTKGSEKEKTNKRKKVINERKKQENRGERKRKEIK